jgi:signal transduction histidine kinase
MTGRFRSSLGGDPFVVAAERPTALLGTLWGTGGLLALLWGLTGVTSAGSVALVVGVGVFATALGGVLLAVRERVFGDAVNIALVLLGSIAICLILFGSGQDGHGPPAILFVYVGIFAYVAIPHPTFTIVAPSLALHAALLLWLGASDPFAALVMIWGATVVASVLIGQAVQATRRAARERERFIAELRDADATKTSFLHAVGHDLAAPAASIIGLAELIAVRDAELAAADRRALLDRLVANTRRLHEDLDGLLRLDDLTTGKVEVERADGDVRALIERAIVRAGVPSDAVVLRDVTGRIHGDLPKLEHAVANLVSNAHKYAGDAGVIDVTVGNDIDRIVISVADHGPGIPEELRERVFEPLVRARSDDAARGSGIGLSLVRSFARLHGGDAWVEDRPGGGACFHLAVPRMDHHGDAVTEVTAGDTDADCLPADADADPRPDADTGALGADARLASGGQ